MFAIRVGSLRALLILSATFCGGALHASRAIAACTSPQDFILPVGDVKKDRMCKFATIQDAIDHAVCAGSNVLVTPTLTYTAQHLTIKNKTLLLYGAKTCSDKITNAAGSQVTIDGTGHTGDSVITILGSGNVALQNLWITGGHKSFVSLLWQQGAGGGVYFDAKGSLTIANSTIVSNYADNGGGIFMTSDAASLDFGDNVLIEFNTARSNGGGILLEGNTRMTFSGTNSSIYSNVAQGIKPDPKDPKSNVADGSAGFGGGIAAYHPASIDLSSPGLGFGGNAGAVLANTATNGGGIALLGSFGCTASLRMFTLDPGLPVQANLNVATNAGGALYLTSAVPTASGRDGVRECVPSPNQAELRDFRLYQNSAAKGAAIFLDENLEERPGSGPQLDINALAAKDALLIKRGAVSCNANPDCNSIQSNVAQTITGKVNTPTDGATVHVGMGSSLTAARTKFRRNSGGNVVHVWGGQNAQEQAALTLSNCLIAENKTTREVLREEFETRQGDFAKITIDSCTIANDSIGAANVMAVGSLNQVLVNQPMLSLIDTIISEGGTNALDFEGDPNLLSASYVMANNATGLPLGLVVQNDPQFVDAAHGNYQLQATSPAVDIAPGAGGGADVAGNVREVDLPTVSNAYGPRDLGAYERQLDVALASNGATATASSTYNANFPTSAAIDGDRTGASWGNGGGWNDATINTFPDYLQINFNASRTIGQVIVYTLQDNYPAGVDPSDTLTFTQQGLTSFDVLVLDSTGSNWILQQRVTNNHLVKRVVDLPNVVTTTAIRIVTNGAADGQFSRIVEVEAWGG